MFIINKIVLTGRWTKDLELSFVQGSGTAVSKGTIAVSRRFKKEGQQEADFIPVVIWGKQAESTANFCGQKGNLLTVVGRIETSTYTNKEGIKVYKTEVMAEEVEFLNSKKDGQGSGQNNSSNSYSGGYDFGGDITPIEDLGDIPFS